MLAVDTLPALSVAVAVTVWGPVAVDHPVTEQAPVKPDSASLAVHVGVAWVLHTVDPAAGALTRATVGFVRSTLKPALLRVGAVLPATSVTEPEAAFTAEPSVVPVAGKAQKYEVTALKEGWIRIDLDPAQAQQIKFGVAVIAPGGAKTNPFHLRDSLQFSPYLLLEGTRKDK